MNKKGISPVIAVLLLIVIAVAMSVLVYVWLTGYMSTLETQSSEEQLQERIRIEAIKIDGTTLTIYVRNIGKVKATIAAAYLINATSNNVLYENTGLSNNVLEPGEIGQVSIPLTSGTSSTSGTSLTSGNIYIVKVVTSTGVEATYRFLYRE